MRALLRGVLKSVAAVLAAMLVVPAASFAASPVGGLSDGRCIDVAQPSIEELRKALDEAIRVGPGSTHGRRNAPSRTLVLTSRLDSRAPNVSVVAAWAPEFLGARPFGQPSGISIETFIRWTPTPSVDAHVPAFLQRLGRERLALHAFLALEEPYVAAYDEVKFDVGKYQMYAGFASEAAGELAGRLAPGPASVKTAAATLAATDLQLLANAIIWVPNLILLPEALVRSPGQVLRGDIRIARGLWHLDSKDALLGVAEVGGGVSTIAGAVALGAGSLESPGRILADAEVEPARPGLAYREPGQRLVIGRTFDLDAEAASQWEGRLKLPDRGTPKANWEQNASKLREAMQSGRPIRDASAEVDGSLRSAVKDDGVATFLEMERNLLRQRGWQYDPGSGTWNPPGYTGETP